MAEHSSQALPARFKRIINTSAGLVQLRLQLLSIEATEQKQQLQKTIMLAVILAVGALLGFITLLFGLNAVLPEHAKGWVFFGLSVFFLIVIISCMVILSKMQTNAQPPFHQSLQEIRKDLHALRGQAEHDQ